MKVDDELQQSVIQQAVLLSHTLNISIKLEGGDWNDIKDRLIRLGYEFDYEHLTDRVDVWSDNEQFDWRLNVRPDKEAI